MYLFHGTKADFDEFDLTKVRTGENSGAAADIGLYFTDNPVGAYNHSWRVNNGVEEFVYVCKLASDAVVINRQEAPISQPPNVLQLWESLPVCHSVHIQNQDWFWRLFRDSCAFPDEESFNSCENLRIKLLQDAGFSAISDFEGVFTDSYLHGQTVLLLDTSKIRIVAKLKSADMMQIRRDFKNCHSIECRNEFYQRLWGNL